MIDNNPRFRLQYPSGDELQVAPATSFETDGAIEATFIGDSSVAVARLEADEIQELVTYLQGLIQ